MCPKLQSPINNQFPYFPNEEGAKSKPVGAIVLSQENSGSLYS